MSRGQSQNHVIPFVIMISNSGPKYQGKKARMYLGIVLIGAAHGLILLPVLLSYIGPRSPYTALHQYYSTKDQIKLHNTTIKPDHPQDECGQADGRTELPGGEKSARLNRDNFVFVI